MKDKYYNQIMNKKEMSIEEAETIIDDMYQDKYKVMEQKTEQGIIIEIGRMDEVTLTNLEFASVRMLREKQSLETKYRRLQEKISEILEYYGHTPADNPDTTMAFYSDIKKLLEDK
nr:MAG TPA: hypothetical protein [Caudoviricetes sp.]